ncbi:MAG: peptide-methionine (S)-S-oxide reductase MsrA [Pseudomonadota bacterium]|nr:peptide-methionine (S)-S-oxide reductase MsrA [Pseudomonadota bacterium]
MFGIGAYKQRLPRAEDALPGRASEMPLRHNRHHVLGTALRGGSEGLARVHFAMGCFWGAERLFWSLPGVVTTAVGYAGGMTPNPTYREVCSGQTGHTEVVLVVHAPTDGETAGTSADVESIAFEALLKAFWEGHDPTQGMRQGNDAGTQYRSAIHCYDESQYCAALASREAYQARLTQAGKGTITTEIVHPAPVFYYAEDEHQQYLSKNPAGYCGLGGTGVSCPIPLGV